jgi:hypothetical protein
VALVVFLFVVENAILVVSMWTNYATLCRERVSAILEEKNSTECMASDTVYQMSTDSEGDQRSALFDRLCDPNVDLTLGVDDDHDSQSAVRVSH